MEGRILILSVDRKLQLSSIIVLSSCLLFLTILQYYCRGLLFAFHDVVVLYFEV